MFLVRTRKAALTRTTATGELFVNNRGYPSAVRIDAMRYADLSDALTEADLWTNGVVLFECPDKCCLYEVTPEGKPAHG